MTITAAPTEPEKSIIYDRETHDYAAYLDGSLIGFARNYVEAEAMLDRVIFDRLMDQRAYEAERQMLVLSQAYKQARAEGRTADAAQIKQQAKELETAHPGIAYEVAEGRKAA